MLSPQEKILLVHRNIIFYLIAIILVITNIVPIKISNLPSIFPMLDIMMIYYFSIVVPGRMPYWFIFVMGVWSDAIMGLPLGLTSLAILIAVKIFTSINTRLIIKRQFHQLWGQYVMFSLLILFIKWVILSIYHGNLYPILWMILQVLISSLLYVVMHKVFGYLNKLLI